MVICATAAEKELFPLRPGSWPCHSQNYAQHFRTLFPQSFRSHWDTKAEAIKVGYARTSTIEQEAGFAAQLRDLQAAGCEKIFQEQVSSVAEREQLDRALDFVREGDTLTVTRLDRLARSVLHLGEIVQQLQVKGVALSIINLGIDTSTATGALILNIMGSIARFERSMMLERQREGIAKARAEGRYLGRTPTAMRQAAAVRQLHQEGVGPAEMGRRLSIGRSSVYRILAGSRS